MTQELMDYFMRETDKKFDLIMKDMKDIKRDVETLIAFRVMLLGLAGAVAAVVSVAVEVIRH